MVRPPFSFPEDHFQIAAVMVVSLAGTFFQSDDLSNAASKNLWPGSALNLIPENSFAMGGKNHGWKLVEKITPPS